MPIACVICEARSRHLRSNAYSILTRFYKREHQYFLMSSNAFGIMLGIFLVLFGLAYPDEQFPGGYRGKETAGIAGVFIFFTLIGCKCSALFCMK